MIIIAGILILFGAFALHWAIGLIVVGVLLFLVAANA